MPITRPKNGLFALVIKLWKASLSLSAPIAESPLIYFNPKKRIPNPRIIWPIYFCVCFLQNIDITTPMIIHIGAIAETSMAISIAVTVVPILAPMITPVACAKSIMPAFKKPISITVVADDDWITAVTSTPSKKPLNLFRVSFSRRTFILLPATWFNPSLIWRIPKRNRPSPPIKLIMLLIPIYYLFK